MLPPIDAYVKIFYIFYLIILSNENPFSPESQLAISQLPSGFGEGKQLFRLVDEQQREENISPLLASTIRQFFIAIEQEHSGTLVTTYTKYWALKPILTSLEDSFFNYIKYTSVTEGLNSSELIFEYKSWMQEET